MDIELVIFDLGNVLINHNAEIFIDEFIKHSGEQRQRVIDVFIKAYSRKFDTGHSSGYDFYNEINEDLTLDLTFEQFKEIYCGIFQEHSEFKPVVYEIMQKYDTAILSNIDELHHNFIMNKWPWLYDIKNIFVSYKMGIIKPDKEIYVKVLSKFGLPAHKTLFIDDKEENVKGAQDVGLNSIHFSETNAVIKELGEYGILKNSKVFY